MSSYCEYCEEHPEDHYNRNYHDHQYGFPIDDDDELFERLILEINQAGLSWITILKKADNFRAAYDQFNIKTVAAYETSEIERLLANPGIIRNQLKIKAAIENARRISTIQLQNGSFKNWLDLNQHLDKAGWVTLFKKNFVFTGGEIVNEFLTSAGYLPGAHIPSCPVFSKIAKLSPPWMNKEII